MDDEFQEQMVAEPPKTLPRALIQSTTQTGNSELLRSFCLWTCQWLQLLWISFFKNV